jgi:zinc and cadmium transporter
MITLLYIIFSSFLISFCAMIAILFLYFNKKFLSKIVIFLVSLSTGALMGGAFLHLLPEASNTIEPNKIYIMVLLAFVFFFFMEKLLHWRHCHKTDCKIHTFGYMNLFGDAIHNFIDGLIIASTFLIDIKLGIVTTIAIAVHEIPQEIGDFGVLIYAGFKKKKAILLNYLVALTVVLGGVIGYILSFYFESFTPYLLPFAAGGFIYISASDLMPEIRKEPNTKKSFISFLIFIIGILLMYLVTFIKI